MSTYTTEDLSQRLNLPLRQLTRWTRLGAIPGATKNNGRWSFDITIIDAWLSPDNKVGSESHQHYLVIHQKAGRLERLRLIRANLMLQLRGQTSRQEPP